jgi:hypothetical protein
MKEKTELSFFDMMERDNYHSSLYNDLLQSSDINEQHNDHDLNLTLN